MTKQENLPVQNQTVNASMMPVTEADVTAMVKHQKILIDYVRQNLTEGIDHDYAIIPGTQKKSLLKPGAQKLRRLFSLGIKTELVQREIDLKQNFAMFTYRATVFHLPTGRDIASCEGSVNSFETKYKTRKRWIRLDNGGRKQVEEETPVGDVMNTIMKMAQKRAIIGATLEATGASDFFSQDIDDEADAINVGLKARDDTQPPQGNHGRDTPPMCCGRPMMISKYKDQDGAFPWYCVTCKNKIARGA